MPRAKDPEHLKLKRGYSKLLLSIKIDKKDPKDPKSSIWRVAKDFNVPRQTLNGRLNGRVAHNQSPRIADAPHR